MLNWCPIGRLAKDSQRQEWINIDTQFDIRKKYLKNLKSFFNKEKIDCTVSLGGSTSLDIYPSGWDKTYCLDHFKNTNCWFVGDKCTGEGNDRTIFEAIGEYNRSFSTRGPQNTCQIIDLIIQNITS